MYQEIMQKLMEIVNDENIAKELFPLLTEEVFENLFLKLSKISSEEELKTYQTRMEESKSPQHLQTIVNEVAVTVYGENASTELKNEYLSLIEKLKTSMDEAKQLVQKAQQGDTEAQKILDEAKQTETYKNLVEQTPSTSTGDSF